MIMRGGIKSQGYTIVEVIIVLAIASALFFVAVLAISGQQARTEYTQAIQDFQSRLVDIANDVNTGIYPNLGLSTKCQVDVTTRKPSFSMGGQAQQGANTDCIFIGKEYLVESKGQYLDQIKSTA